MGVSGMTTMGDHGRPWATTGDHGRPSRPFAAASKSVVENDNTPALPLLIEAHKIAKLIGWDRRKAIRLLRQLRILQEIASNYFVDRNDLREKLPSAYRELERRWETGELPQQKRREYKRRPRVTTGDHGEQRRPLSGAALRGARGKLSPARWCHPAAPS